jgi:hypothetical protein
MAAFNLSAVSIMFYRFLIVSVNCGIVLLIHLYGCEIWFLAWREEYARVLSNMLWTAVRNILHICCVRSTICSNISLFLANKRFIPHFLYLPILSFMFFSCTVMHRCTFILFILYYDIQQVASVVWWLACCPLVPEFTGSNPAKAIGFFRAKGSKAVCPISQICGMLKNPVITWKLGHRQNLSAISHPFSSLANRDLWCLCGVERLWSWWKELRAVNREPVA